MHHKAETRSGILHVEYSRLTIKIKTSFYITTVIRRQDLIFCKRPLPVSHRHPQYQELRGQH